jgi:hypothetical protein
MRRGCSGEPQMATLMSAQRALAALLLIADRCSAVSLRARATPPRALPCGSCSCATTPPAPDACNCACIIGRGSPRRKHDVWCACMQCFSEARVPRPSVPRVAAPGAPTASSGLAALQPYA